ncbi:DUF4166 domain-containing protein [Sporosarcina sp. Marseille-Q4063]|uniref:DUF4166 domain-containing protein n=1 Tax=Sporosarcina sp. Marseille-Q4063 TaxID=2810514 RepID=UPI001BAF81DB|nr:DUF4166 domain-containing protein [Sporosarcina sp. Marseille-Q4063]QUW23142.1 DUF4166 domain-containing protein [Sporosarcina sp. Marseille-Q4063]
MSIFKKVMGNDFSRLHPMLQKRYNLPEGTIFKASGIMNEIKGGPKWLSPLFRIGTKWKLLFPERGKSIPFSITNTSYITEDGESHVHWQRIFYFGNQKRYFNALMSLDEKRVVIKDYLGEPHVVYADLAFTVTAKGHLKITSLNQRLVLGKLEIPLPKLFQGLATVTEKYVDELGCYQITVHVENPLIGTVFSYEGKFYADEDA